MALDATTALTSDEQKATRKAFERVMKGLEESKVGGRSV